MRQTFTLLIIIAFCSCGQKSKQTKAPRDNVSAEAINNTDTSKTNRKLENKTMDLTILEWEKHEDSLRNEIFKRKENEILKKSFLQELYIRNAVTISKDSLFVTIPFNLHGPDCLAPDCYSTDISFSFKLGDALIFPEKLQFQEHEHGCVEKISKLSGVFQLIEQSDRHVIYHSATHKRTLVLFSSNDESGSIAYFFTDVKLNRINGKNVYRIVRDYSEEDKNSIYPFTSWILSTSEYENFLN
jgi:hypothetical protein